MPAATRGVVQKQLVTRSLKHFTKYFWRRVENREMDWGWHIDAINDHLTAVANGEIKRLMINIPPRHMKSLSCSVFFPAWCWLRKPETQFLCASYNGSLSMRDCRKSRLIIESEEYKRMIDRNGQGEPCWKLSGDQNAKSRYENTAQGYRVATSVGGGLTGEGGDIILVDDPHNVVDISSTSLQTARDWWDESLSTRLNDASTGAYILIMQRVNQADLCGHILDKKDPSWTHLCLPARYEGSNRTTSKLGFVDPRTKKDEPLWAERFPDAVLKGWEREMTSFARAGQLQQRPTPKGGGDFKKEDFMIIDDFDESQIIYTVRYWDKAGSEGKGDYTVGVRMHQMRNGTFVIDDVCRGQWSYAKREARILAVSESDLLAFKKYEIRIEQEAGSGGKESAERTKKALKMDDQGNRRPTSGARVSVDKVTGSKQVRAEPYAVRVENHQVFVLRRPWTEDFIDEHLLFPNGAHDDQVDCGSGCVSALTGKKKQVGTFGS